MSRRTSIPNVIVTVGFHLEYRKEFEKFIEDNVEILDFQEKHLDHFGNYSFSAKVSKEEFFSEAVQGDFKRIINANYIVTIMPWY